MEEEVASVEAEEEGERKEEEKMCRVTLIG